MIELSRDQKTLLYVLKGLDECRSAGLLIGPETPLTQTAQDMVEAHIDAGFEPTQEEMERALEFIQSGRFWTALESASSPTSESRSG